MNNLYNIPYCRYKNLYYLLTFITSFLKLSAQDIKQFQEANGMVTVEAEYFYKQTKTEIRKWYTIASGFNNEVKKTDTTIHVTNASKKRYIEVLPDTRVTHDDKLIKGINFSNVPGKMAIVHYKVNFSKPGRYYIWARAYSTGKEDNGVHVGYNGLWPESGQRIQWCEGKNAWTWSNRQRTLEKHCGVPGLIYLDINEAGLHDIQFSMREDGFEFDQWIMTTDKNFNPNRKNKKKVALKPSLLNTINEIEPQAIVLRAHDFKNKKNEFYKDKSWLAINPEKYNLAEASIAFNGPSGSYDIILFTIGENDGRSLYSLVHNDFVSQPFRTPLSSVPFEEGLSFTKTFENIKLKNKDLLGLRVIPKSRDGKEFSRGRWSGMVLVKAGTSNALIKKVKKELAAQTNMVITGELKKWHKVTLTFDGPLTSEDATFNPFMNYRFNTLFLHKTSGKKYLIPGYYAADGDAGQTSAKSGNKWRVHFAPDEVGEWVYSVDFRKGNWTAVSSKEKSGLSGAYMDGATGTFTIENTDKKGRDFRGKGRLQYCGERYLKFSETGTYFLKQGPDAPENFLSYVDFDGTYHNDGHRDDLVKTWQAHFKDWKKGDPTWRNGKGKSIIGALNYLASKGLNSVSFLTNNIMGDDKNVFPYIDYNTYDRIDVSKMDQWELLFSHAQKLGLFLHFKMFEDENQGLLDNGGLGAHRKLYFRELIARFGHHLALNWNLCEENGEWLQRHVTPPQDAAQRLAMTHYFKENDPYRHHLVIHNGIPYDDLLGSDSGLTGPSLQTHKSDFSEVHKKTLHWINASKASGFPWAVAVDEPGDAQHALLPDKENPNHDLARRNALWGTLMAGGWGNEWYFGYKHEHSDLSCQDYRSRDLFWDQAKNAINFFHDNAIPFWKMESRNDLVGNFENSNTVYCMAKEGEIYVVYLNAVTTANLNLSKQSGKYEVSWYNPKLGGSSQKTMKIKAGKMVRLGNPPEIKQKDWVIIIKKII